MAAGASSISKSVLTETGLTTRPRPSSRSSRSGRDLTDSTPDAVSFWQKACRRLMAVAEAQEVASRPDWTIAKFFSDPRGGSCHQRCGSSSMDECGECVRATSGSLHRTKLQVSNEVVGHIKEQLIEGGKALPHHLPSSVQRAQRVQRKARLSRTLGAQVPG